MPAGLDSLSLSLSLSLSRARPRLYSPGLVRPHADLVLSRSRARERRGHKFTGAAVVVAERNGAASRILEIYPGFMRARGFAWQGS